MSYSIIDGFPSYLACSDGFVINAKNGNQLIGTVKKTGYREIVMTDSLGKQKSVLLHRIIASCFCDKPDGADEVNHIDGNKDNNFADNLEWVTRNENLKHAFNAGLRMDDVSARRVIATNIETGEEIEFSSIYKAARFFNISQGNICMCCKGMRPYANGYFWRYANE